MTVTINGTTGLAGVDGSAGTPAVQGGDTNTGMFFPAADTIAFAEGGAEVARFDSSGNFGIGTSSPVSRLTVAGASAVLSLVDTDRSVNTYGAVWADQAGNVFLNADYDGTAGGGFISFRSNGSNASAEKMRIDSSGNLLVGATSRVWDERELVRSDTNTVKLGVYGNATSFTSSIIRAQVETAAGAGWYFFEGRAAGGSFQYGIRGNGTVATSDERRKKNIEPARSYLQDICSIPIVKYNWKTDEDNTPKELGWLAQDVQKVFPNMVVTHHDGPNDDQEVLLLKKEVFVPMLMKCIQEQQALITGQQAMLASLTARIEALEQLA